MVQAHQKKNLGITVHVPVPPSTVTSTTMINCALRNLNFKLGSGLCATVETEFHLISFLFED